MTLVFVDDASAADFLPFALTRPCCELRAGALLVRQRWERATRESTTGFVGAPHLVHFDEPGAPPFVDGTIPAGSILVNARCAVSLGTVAVTAPAWSCGGKLAAVRLIEPTSVETVVHNVGKLEGLAGQESPAELDGKWLDNVWDLIRHLPELLSADIPHLAEWSDQGSTSAREVIGSLPVFIDDNTVVEPSVILLSTADT